MTVTGTDERRHSSGAMAGDVEADAKQNMVGHLDATVAVDPKRQAALVRRQDLRIIPLSAGIYLLCYLDRSNIGNAKVLNRSTGDDLLSVTGMTNYEYTISLMVFLIAYALFEVPSNYFLKKTKPSQWIAFLMITWGTVTMCLGAAQDFASVTAMRALLGVFEAGE
jgi:sugar phosphate permease